MNQGKSVDTAILEVQGLVVEVLGSLRGKIFDQAAEIERLRAELAAAKPVADDHK